MLCRRAESVLTRIPIFASFVGRLVNTPLVACHSCGWRVYTQSYLGVHGVTVGWPQTNGTANNERVHSFCWFLPNPFIEDLFFWCSSQGFVKADLHVHCHKAFWSLYGMPSVWPGAGQRVGRCFELANV